MPNERTDALELRHLAAFEAIVRTGSFRGAAESLGYAQSAISRQLLYLERLVGARLIERAPGSPPIALTPAGRLLMKRTDTILARLDRARADLEDVVDGRVGTLRVGAFQSVATRLLPRLLPGVQRSGPGTTIVATECRADVELFDRVEQGDVDLAFCQLPLLDGPFHGVELFRDPFVLLASARASLAEAPSLAVVGRLPLIGFNRSRAQDHVLDALRSHGVEPELIVRSDSNTTVQALVAERAGAAIVPRLCIDSWHPGTTALELSAIPPRRIALIWRRDRRPSGAAEAFTVATRAMCRRWNR